MCQIRYFAPDGRRRSVRKTKMKKMILLALAAVAFTTTARVFTIELGNGDIKLDRKYLQYGSADLIGIECITANDSGSVSLSVGKHMEAKKKIVSYIPVYETNVTVRLNHKEYDWIGKSVYTYVSDPGEPGERTKSETNEFTFAQKSYPEYDTFTTRIEGMPDAWTLVDTQNGFTNFTLNGSINTFSGTHSFTGAASYDTPQYSINISISDRRYSGYTFDFEYVGTKTQVIEYYDYITNIVQVATITNVVWQPVNRTCYQSVISTNLNDGIIINYLENPIRLFRNDYLRSTCPINDETNPGIYHAIMKDEGAASIIL